MTHHIIGDDTRARIAKFLPKALGNALASYHQISSKKPEDPKNADGNRVLDPVMHKKHHEALKVALAHIELLVKLAQRAHLPDAKGNAGIEKQELDTMLKNANSEIASKQE